MDNRIICLGIIIVVVAIGAFSLMNNSNTDTVSDDDYYVDYNLDSSPFYLCKGSIKPKSSDLTLYYNNDESVYGYFSPGGEFLGIAYYNDAKIRGEIKYDLKKVKWSDNDTDSDYAMENFTRDFKDKYKYDKEDIDVTLEFKDKKGKTVDLYDLSRETGNYYDSKGGYNYEIKKPPIKIYLKNNTLTVKVNHRFTVNSTPISNAPPYDGDLAQEPSDFDKTYKAVLNIDFKNDNCSYTLESTLKGDNFNIVHT